MFTLDSVRKFHGWTHASLTLMLDHVSTVPAGDYIRELPGFGFPTLRRQVIHIFLGGGLSQVDSFDYKPELEKYHGKEMPERFGKADAFFGKVGQQIGGCIRFHLFDDVSGSGRIERFNDRFLNFRLQFLEGLGGNPLVEGFENRIHQLILSDGTHVVERFFHPHPGFGRHGPHDAGHEGPVAHIGKDSERVAVVVL